MPMALGKRPGYARAPVLYDTVRFAGGTDMVSPVLDLAPGVVRASSNFEISTSPMGGYDRIAGYERFDGQRSPTNTSYFILQLTANLLFTPANLDTVSGQTSGATAVVINQGANYLIVTASNGVFVNGDPIYDGVTLIGYLTTPPSMAVSTLQHAQWTQNTADYYRSFIQKVPGEGPVIGVFTLIVAGENNTYAMRGDTGQTQVLLYKASNAGWVNVPLMNEIYFTAGDTAAPPDGSTLRQGGVTAVIKRVVLQSGDWLASTGAGSLVITSISGGSFAAGAAVIETVGGVPISSITLAGTSTAITLNPGGRVVSTTGNFFGQSGTIRIYGVDGVNRAFEFDGETYVPISTMTSPDAPKYLAVHQRHLILTVKSSLIISGTGTPYNYTAGAGALEIAVGDILTGLLIMPGQQSTGALFVYAVNTTYVLYGTDTAGSAPFQLVTYRLGVGALDYSAQNLYYSYVLDDPGVMCTQTTFQFGNFLQSTLTFPVYPFIAQQHTNVISSIVCRGKSQYRLFFFDGSALYLTIVNGKNLGSMIQNFPHRATCTSNSEQMRVNGAEDLFFGTADGYVMNMDKGSSFDGATLDAYLTLNYDFMRTPRVRKRFRKASLTITSNFYVNVSAAYTLGYHSQAIDQGGTGITSYTGALLQTGAFDSGIIWDSFIWDGQTITPSEIELTGTAENIQFTFASGTNYIMPYSLNSLVIHYTLRRGLR